MNDTTPKPRELWGTLTRVLPELARSAPRLVGLMVVVAIFEGAVPALTILLGKWTVDGIASIASGAGGLSDNLGGNLMLLAIAWAGTALLGQLLIVARGMLQGYIVDFFSIHVTESLMQKMQDLQGLDVLESAQFHDDMEILQSQVHVKPINLTASVLSMLNGFITIVGIASTLLLIGWWVPLVVILGVLPLARKQRALYSLGWSMTIKNTQDARELRYDQRVAMRYEYAKELRLFGLLPYLRRRYLTRAYSYQATMRDVRNKQLVEVLPYQILMLAVTSGIFIYVVLQARTGTFSVGDVTLLISALAQIRRELGSLVRLINSHIDHLSWFHKYYAFVDAVPRVTMPELAQPLPEKLDLRLEAVSFRYREDRPLTLENISLHIPEGQTVAIVGENGAGKSTLVKLLLRFYDPSTGSITLGAEPAALDLRNVDIEAWRAQVGAVFQDFAKFEWSLRQNILLGEVEDSDRLAKVVQDSGMATVLERIGGDLDSRIGQAFDGLDLSGGQWQKLVMARAMYRSARVLILDEPTAALDPRSEADVFASFAALSRGRTTILITHRLGSVQMADRIIVMKAGRIIEDGSHQSLLARDGEYAELWRLQAQQYAGGVEGYMEDGMSGY